MGWYRKMIGSVVVLYNPKIEEIAISPLKSIGYFGTALFAFLSGYWGKVNKDKVIKMGEKVVNKKNMCCIYSLCDC